MPLQLKKIAPVDLRSLGLDEKWLQDQISEDPGILGLGELEIAGREHRQPVGGRAEVRGAGAVAALCRGGDAGVQEDGGAAAGTGEVGAALASGPSPRPLPRREGEIASAGWGTRVASHA